MALILDIRPDCTDERLEVYCVADSGVATFNPQRDPCACFTLDPKGPAFKDGKIVMAYIDGLLAAQKAAALTEAARTAVDVAVETKLSEWKAAVDYAKTPAENVQAVISAAKASVAEVKP